MLRDRQSDASDVGLLKSVVTDQLAAHLARDADDRRRIHHRRGNARDQVGCTRPRGGNGDADSAAGARVTVGHVRRALFVPHQHVVDLGVFAQRVIGRQNRSTRITEDVLHAFALEAFPDNLSTGFLHKLHDLSLLCVPSCPLWLVKFNC